MTVFQVHHSWTPGEPKTDVEYDEIPASCFQLWEVRGGYEWQRNGSGWSAYTPIGLGEAEFTEREMLEDFGPLTDDPSEITHERGCPICGPDGEGCAGHTRTAETALAPLSGGAA